MSTHANPPQHTLRLEKTISHEEMNSPQTKLRHQSSLEMAIKYSHALSLLA